MRNLYSISYDKAFKPIKVIPKNYQWAIQFDGSREMADALGLEYNYDSSTEEYYFVYTDDEYDGYWVLVPKGYWVIRNEIYYEDDENRPYYNIVSNSTFEKEFKKL